MNSSHPKYAFLKSLFDQAEGSKAVTEIALSEETVLPLKDLEEGLKETSEVKK